MKKSMSISKINTVYGSQISGTVELKKFENFIPNNSGQTQKEREEDILKYGIQEPFFFGGIGKNSVKYHLLWGHLDYQFALENKLCFPIIKMKFSSEDEVKVFIIRKNLNRLHMSKFQRGVIALQNKDSFIKVGRENMRKGGQGIEVEKTEKWNTMKQLSDIVDCSIETLNKIEIILKRLKDEEKYRQLENNEISIHKVYLEVMGGTKCKDRFPFKKSSEENSNSTTPEETTLSFQTNKDSKSTFYINEIDQYPLIVIRPHWNLVKSDMSKLFVEDLSKMNVDEISYHKFSTLIIQTPSLYLSDTIELVKTWGFNCVDTLTVSFNESRYQSNYSEHYNEFLLICHKNNVGVPKNCILNKSNEPTIPNEDVMDTIDSMFNKDLTRVGIFTEYRNGWDTYNFYPDLKEMVKFYKKVG